jgi:hypothetical protein
MEASKGIWLRHHQHWKAQAEWRLPLAVARVLHLITESFQLVPLEETANDTQRVKTSSMILLVELPTVARHRNTVEAAQEAEANLVTEKTVSPIRMLVKSR